MAHFRKRGNLWYYTIQGGINPKTGKYLQIQRGGFKTKKEAQAAAAEAQLAVDSNTFVQLSGVTFKDFAAEWLESYALNVKKSSVRIRKHQIALMCEVLGQVAYAGHQSKDISESPGHSCEKQICHQYHFRGTHRRPHGVQAGL